MSGFFSRKFVKLQVANGKIPDKVTKVFRRKVIAYVMISCGEVNSKGEMEVEMTYEGDKYLVSYMLENARELMESKL